MPLYSRQDLADYCLRTLGAPVLNIEIADEQLGDAIENAINYYNDYHPDGLDRDYLKHKITFTKLELDDASLVQVGDVVRDDKENASVMKVEGNILTLRMNKGPGTWTVGNTVTFPAGTAVVVAVTLGDPDNRWIPIDENIQGVIRVMPWVLGFGDGLFDITYQLRMNDLRNLSSGTMNYFTSTMEYLSMLDFLLRKEKAFRFNRRMNRLYLDINWDQDVREDTFIVVECYRLIDDTEFPEVYNDPWLKKYAAAWVKRYWGANLRKYNGLALPGGITLDGERIYGEAHAELAALEEDMINNQAPLQWIMG
jgi:hypothetical protein